MAVQSVKGSRYVPAALHYGKTDYADANGTLTLPNGGTAHEMPYAGKIIAFSQTFVGTLDTGTLQFAPVIAGVVGTTFDGTVTSTAAVAGPTTSIYATVNDDRYAFNAGDALSILVTKAGTVSPTSMDSDGFVVVVFEDVEY